MLAAIEPKHLYESIAKLGTSKIAHIGIYNLDANIPANTSFCTQLQLVPPIRTMNPSSQEFDDWYISTILTNDVYFSWLMKIMVDLRDGKDVFLLVYREETTFDPINEVILKLIQKRYGYNYHIIDNSEDVLDLLCTDSSTFTTEGIITFDSDFERYLNIIRTYNPTVFTNEIIDDTHL
jgi:hypothetical protein